MFLKQKQYTTFYHNELIAYNSNVNFRNTFNCNTSKINDIRVIVVHQIHKYRFGFSE